MVEARSAHDEAALSSAGFEFARRIWRGRPAYCQGSEPARASGSRSYWSAGRAVVALSVPVDYDMLETSMDPRDRTGAAKEPSSAKMARSYAPIPWEPSRWDIGLPEELDEMMAKQGVGIHPLDEPGGSEVPFYPFASREGLVRSIVEADRAVAVGAMEYVPSEMAAEVEALSTIHPWTIVDQGGGKWRLCHDYSVGTNRVVPSGPFSLPTVWDVSPIVKPGSRFAKYDIRDGFWHVPIAPDSRKRLVVRHPGDGRLLWASRLPFGFLEAPRLFCSLTEAIIQRLRLRAAGRGMHFFVFVDDVLCVGDDDELCAEGCKMIEEEFEARGLQWAPHKKRGPCACIDFLGLMLSNVAPFRGITVTRSRLQKVQAELIDWKARQPASGDLEADPVELARLLGRLVFTSQVVRGGRTYMQGMLAAFQGLVVDWNRGKVSRASGEWSKLTITPGFWRDLDWWIDHLEGRCLVPFEAEARPAEAVLSGTDASGWGTGQVIWLDGSREETHMIFTHAEKRRPINWRELLGIVRVAEVYGARLRGKVLLVETDNMAAKGAVRKLASKAADMQELVRRLHRLAETHGFELRVTHTPGAKLDRPDQTSRGDSVEEPRVRVTRSIFTLAEQRWGPFGSFLGAEREWGKHSDVGGARSSFWVHPTVSTVGSALRLLGQRMAASRGGQNFAAIAVVPNDGAPAWAGMLRHGVVVGRVCEGDEVLEVNELGRWRRARVYRPSQFVLFPRAAGAVVRRVALSHRGGMEIETASTPGGARTRGAGYTVTSDGTGLRLPLLPGSFVYSLPQAGHARGCLQQVMLPTEEERAADPDVLITCEAELASAQAAKRLSDRPVFDVKKKPLRSRPDPRELFTVDHLVDELKGGVTFSRFAFDFQKANVEIVRAFGQQPVAANDWVMLSPDDSPVLHKTAGGSLSGYEPFDLSPAEGEPSAEPEGLDEVVQALEKVFVSQAAEKTGGEGVLAPRRGVAAVEETIGVRGACEQRCQYVGIRCYGCEANFAIGAVMESCTPGLVHPNAGCRVLAKHRIATEAAAEVASKNAPPTYWGVYSDEPGASGVYTSQGRVDHLLEPEVREKFGVQVESFSTHASAHAFVDRMAKARAVGFCEEVDAVHPQEAAKAVPGYGSKGSTTRVTHLSEKLAPSHLDSIRTCVSGRCGRHRDGTETPCRGGCGRSLHMVDCAHAGKGFAALGNFLCVDCRLRKSNQDPDTASPQLRRINEVTMVLELCQGAESSAAGYADFVQLEERYVLGMGQVLDGPDLIMPRHSKIAFKNFLTWMATDANRARSLESVFRSAGSFFAKLLEHDAGRGTTSSEAVSHREPVANFTRDKGVSAHLKELLKEVGVEHEPATACTPRMFKLALDQVIPERCINEFLALREAVQFIAEGVGGVRIGEVCGGGETHGLLANHASIFTDLETGEVVVEGHLEHSKTGFSRYLDMVGKTKTTEVEVADIFARYWEAAGIPTMQIPNMAGVHVTRPDFYVVRVGLLGVGNMVGQLPLERLLGYLTRCTHVSVQTHLGTSKLKATERVKAGSTGSQAKKYINVAGGRGADGSLVRLRDEIAALGFHVSIVPGPLLLASTGGKSSRPTLMPLSSSSTFTLTKEILNTSYLLANKDPSDPDPDLEVDFAAGEKPKWTTHSLRRMADTVARRYRELTGVSEADIDLFFGWNERVLLKAMQVHYASMSVKERMKKALVTCMA
jgi:hypothetical protein